MYPNMQTKELQVDDKTVLTDSEGYIVHMDDWSEGFVTAQADLENLALTDEHWQVVLFCVTITNSMVCNVKYVKW